MKLNLIALLLFVTPTAHATLSSSYMNINGLNVHVGIEDAHTAEIKGDIVYFTGFADYIESHQLLFDSWADAGFRVITFDFPSQGKTTGHSLNRYSIKSLAFLGSQIEQKTRVDNRRPLLLSGWSTGGLIVTRVLQSYIRIYSPARLAARSCLRQEFPCATSSATGMIGLGANQWEP